MDRPSTQVFGEPDAGSGGRETSLEPSPAYEDGRAEKGRWCLGGVEMTNRASR